MTSFFPEYGLIWYLEELNRKTSWSLSRSSSRRSYSMGWKIPWTEVKKMSWEDLANLLMNYSEKKAWDVTFKIFKKINRKDLSEWAAREIAGHSKIDQAHLKMKLTRNWSRKFNIPIQDFLKQKFTQDECNCFEHLFVSKTT